MRLSESFISEKLQCYEKDFGDCGIYVSNTRFHEDRYIRKIDDKELSDSQKLVVFIRLMKNIDMEDPDLYIPECIHFIDNFSGDLSDYSDDELWTMLRFFDVEESQLTSFFDELKSI